MSCSFCHFFNSVHNNHHLFLILFLLPSITQVVLPGEGRRTTLKPVQSEAGEDDRVYLTSKIGSRPPRCERIRRCISCGGQCEAVQVPALPIGSSSKKGSKVKKYRSSTGVTASRGDDSSSNYKPLSWKCKCGDTIFNPRD